MDCVRKYELVQTSPTLKKQTLLLQSVAVPQAAANRRALWQTDDATKALTHLLSTTDFYTNLIALAGVQTAKDAMKIVAKEIEKDGLHSNTTEDQQHEAPL